MTERKRFYPREAYLSDTSSEEKLFAAGHIRSDSYKFCVS